MIRSRLAKAIQTKERSDLNYITSRTQIRLENFRSMWKSEGERERYYPSSSKVS